MEQRKSQVRRFYDVLWNAHNKIAIASVLSENFSFRGSLGQEKRGHQGFAEYLDMVHAALDDYRCTIDELVAEEDKVFAKMTFGGVHIDKFMGYDASGKRLEWKGCALFTFQDDLISDSWVLGDLKKLEDQLKRNET
jgi:steroid delta-isomerase-like uncharacterized protein